MGEVGFFYLYAGRAIKLEGIPLLKRREPSLCLQYVIEWGLGGSKNVHFSQDPR